SGVFIIREFTSTTVNCTLGESCCLEFDELLCHATNYRPTEASAPQGGPAEYEVSLSGTSTLTIGGEVVNLGGEAGYGFCASETMAACPFFLDRLEASGDGSTTMRLDCDDSSFQIVNVTDIEVRLAQ